MTESKARTHTEGQSRASHRFRPGLERRVLSYALAAGATGAGVVCATPAHADIIYTPANFTFGPHQTVYLDLNHDGTRDFGFFGYFYGYGTWTGIFTKGLQSGDNFLNSPMSAGGSIGPKIVAQGGFVGGPSEMVGCLYSVFCFGPWVGVTNEFMGFEFQAGGKEYFGWAEFTVPSYGVRATLEGYAYNNIAGQPIFAGETTATPEPGMLGLLALGALGLGYWRRKKTAS